MPENFLEAGERLLKERGIELEPLEAYEADKPADSKAAEEKSEEAEKETLKTEEADTEEVEDSEEESKTEEVKEPQKDAAKQHFKQREGRRNNELKELAGKVDTLTGLVQQLAQARSPEKQEEAKDELADFASEQNLDAEGLKRLVGIIQKKIQPADKPAEQEPEYKEAEEAQIFNVEWDDFQEQVEEKFKNSTPSQWKKAKVLMDELSHSEDYHDKDLDYVYFKNKQAFDDILFAPKKKSAETSRVGDAEYEEEGTDFDNEITNVKDAIKAQKDMYKHIQKDQKIIIHRNGEEIVL